MLMDLPIAFKLPDSRKFLQRGKDMENAKSIADEWRRIVVMFYSKVVRNSLSKLLDTSASLSK
jgi:hypothetical protein